MRLGKKTISWLIIGFILIQFIQPTRNKNDKILPNDMQKIYSVPDKVLAVLQNSCYDCHSNDTRYPWYSFIQPGAWLMASHIRKGIADLNFNEFGVYSNRKQQNKLQAIVNSIKDETMPLKSYSLFHKDAKLSAEDRALLFDWINITKDNLSSGN